MTRPSFPANQLAQLIDIADGLRNRPSFSNLLSLLEELFVDVLRYQSDDLDITRRVDLPPSAHTQRVVSVAGAAGLRVCAVERDGSSFYPSAYLKLFRLYPDCIVFVHSNVDQRVRVLLRPRQSSKRTYRYRSLTPRAVMGPRSDFNASWALRLGLLRPDITEPSHVNYAVFEQVLFDSPAELLEMHDPFQWDNRQEWAEALGLSAWMNHLPQEVARFLQVDKRRGERRASGLHEALLRSFPIYVQGKADQKLLYDDYEVRRSSDGGWDIVVHLRLVIEKDGRKDEWFFDIPFELPSTTDDGYLLWKGQRWRFCASVGLVPVWDDGPPGESTSGDEIETDESQSIEDEEIDDQLESEIVEEEAVPLSVWEESTWDGDDAGQQDDEIRFLSLSRALGYGVMTEIRRLRWHLRNRKIDEPNTVVDHTEWLILHWKLGRNRSEPKSLLPHLFLEDFFEPVSTEGLQPSKIGHHLRAHAVKSDKVAPRWSCQLLAQVYPEWSLPVAASVIHPIRREFVFDSQAEPLSGVTYQVVEQVGVARAVEALRFLVSHNRWRSARTLLVPGDVPGVAVRRGAFVAERGGHLRSKIRRQLTHAQPLSAAPRARTVETHQKDERNWLLEIQPDSRLDSTTGLIRPGSAIRPGLPLAARAVGAEQQPLSAEEKLAGAILFDDFNSPPPTWQRDRSWYAPAGVGGVVREVSFEGEALDGAGFLTLLLEDRLGLDRGAHISADIGVGGPVTRHLSDQESPFLCDGEPVDMVVTVPQEIFYALDVQSEVATTVFDSQGEPIDDVVLVEQQRFTISKVPTLSSNGVKRRFNLRERPLRTSATKRFSALVLAAQLDGLGAGRGLEQFIEALSRHREPHVTRTQAALRFEQLLVACGFDARIGEEEASVALHAPRPGESLVLRHPGETLNYRTKDAKLGGLFDPRRFRPMPREFIEAGGVSWAVEPSSRWARREQQLRARNSRRRLTGRGPLRLTERYEPARGLCFMRLVEPVINPLLEEVVADYLELEHEELVSVACGFSRLDISRDSAGTLAWRLEPVDGAECAIASEADDTGVRAIQHLLGQLAEQDDTAARLKEAVWDFVPVLPPEWRPILEGSEEIPWVMSDLNTLYVQVAHTAKRVEQAYEHAGVLPCVHLQGARLSLRQKLRELYGVAESPVRTWINFRRFEFEEREFELRGIGDLMSHFLHSRLLMTETDSLPHSIRGDWFATDGVASVSVPAEHLLECWDTSLAQRILESGRHPHWAAAYRAVKTGGHEAFSTLDEMLEDGHAFGYLLTESGAVTPVRVAVERNSSGVGVDHRLAEQLGLRFNDHVMVYLPPGEEAKKEARSLAAFGSTGQRYGCDQDVVASLLSDWGHVRCETLEVASDGPQLPVHGSNLGSWFVSQLAHWPTHSQRALVHALREGRLTDRKAVVSFVEDLPDECHALPVHVAAALSDQARSHSNTELIWRLAQPDALQKIATRKVEFEFGDFLSALLLSRSDVMREPAASQPVVSPIDVVLPSEEPKKPSVDEFPGEHEPEDENEETLVPVSEPIEDVALGVGEDEVVLSSSLHEAWVELLEHASPPRSQTRVEEQPVEEVESEEEQQPVEKEEPVEEVETVEEEEPVAEEQSEGKEQVSPNPAQLVIRRNGTVGRVFAVSDMVMIIGCFNIDTGVFPDIDLEEEDRYNRISDRHARIFWDDNRWHIEDIGSANGISHNRSPRLKPREPVELDDGDELIIGKLFLEFQIADEEPS